MDLVQKIIPTLSILATLLCGNVYGVTRLGNPCHESTLPYYEKPAFALDCWIFTFNATDFEWHRNYVPLAKKSKTAIGTVPHEFAEVKEWVLEIYSSDYRSLDEYDWAFHWYPNTTANRTVHLSWLDGFVYTRWHLQNQNGTSITFGLDFTKSTGQPAPIALDASFVLVLYSTGMADACMPDSGKLFFPYLYPSLNSAFSYPIHQPQKRGCIIFIVNTKRTVPLTLSVCRKHELNAEEEVGDIVYENSVLLEIVNYDVRSDVAYERRVLGPQYTNLTLSYLDHWQFDANPRISAPFRGGQVVIRVRQISYIIGVNCHQEFVDVSLKLQDIQLGPQHIDTDHCDQCTRDTTRAATFTNIHENLLTYIHIDACQQCCLSKYLCGRGLKVSEALIDIDYFRLKPDSDVNLKDACTMKIDMQPTFAESGDTTTYLECDQMFEVATVISLTALTVALLFTCIVVVIISLKVRRRAQRQAIFASHTDPVANSMALQQLSSLWNDPRSLGSGAGQRNSNNNGGALNAWGGNDGSAHPAELSFLSGPTSPVPPYEEAIKLPKNVPRTRTINLISPVAESVSTTATEDNTSRSAEVLSSDNGTPNAQPTSTSVPLAVDSPQSVENHNENHNNQVGSDPNMQENRDQIIGGSPPPVYNEQSERDVS